MELQEGTRGLKVLVIDEEVPYPPDAGKRIRTWNLLKRLARKHEVHFLCYGVGEHSGVVALRSAGIVLHLIKPLQSPNGLHLCMRLAANLLSRYPFSVAKHHSRRFQRAFDDLLERGNWDLIQCEWTPYARFLSSKRIATLITTHNVESQIWARRAEHSTRWAERLFFGLQSKKMLRFERLSLLRANAVTAVSSADAETMRKWGVARITVVPNGVDPEFYEPGENVEHENEILSIASLDWFPNVDALEYFVREIFPRIREHLPSAVFRIVGRRPPQLLRATLAEFPGIAFVGEVKDVRPYLDQAAVIVVPLRIGGGSRLKILEALAARKAVVSTSIGAEGLDLDAEKHLVVADSPWDFARRTVELLTSKEKRRCLGENGRRRVIERYSWDGIASRLEDVWLNNSQCLPGAHAYSSADYVHAAP
jgi:polysaccharide biosynthesis protein PslH